MKILENLLKSIIRKVIKVDNLNWDINQILEPTHGAFRGTPMDRVLLQRFFETANLPRNHFNAIEVGSIEYLDRYFQCDNEILLEYRENQPLEKKGNTLVGDLRKDIDEDLKNSIDLIVSTQVMCFIDDYQKVLQGFLDLLKAGGYLIGSEPFLSPMSIYDDSRSGDFRRFTQKGLRYEFEKIGLNPIVIEPYGNESTSVFQILGIAEEDVINIENVLNSNTSSHATLITYIIQK